MALITLSIPWLEITGNTCNCCLNLLKFVMVYLREVSTLDVEELKTKYLQDDILWRVTRYDINDKKQTISWNEQLSEDWNSFEKNQKENFWFSLKLLQSSAVSQGIRLLGFLAKRDSSFNIRMTYIEDAFNMFLYNITRKNYFKLKAYDGGLIALLIIKIQQTILN